jgi:hypothetical protein
MGAVWESGELKFLPTKNESTLVIGFGRPRLAAKWYW